MCGRIVEIRTKARSKDEDLNLLRFGIFENILIIQPVGGNHLLRLEADLLLTFSFGLSFCFVFCFAFCLNCFGLTLANYLK